MLVGIGIGLVEAKFAEIFSDCSVGAFSTVEMEGAQVLESISLRVEFSVVIKIGSTNSRTMGDYFTSTNQNNLLPLRFLLVEHLLHLPGLVPYLVYVDQHLPRRSVNLSTCTIVKPRNINTKS